MSVEIGKLDAGFQRILIPENRGDLPPCVFASILVLPSLIVCPTLSYSAFGKFLFFESSPL